MQTDEHSGEAMFALAAQSTPGEQLVRPRSLLRGPWRSPPDGLSSATDHPLGHRRDAVRLRARGDMGGRPSESSIAARVSPPSACRSEPPVDSFAGGCRGGHGPQTPGGNSRRTRPGHLVQRTREHARYGALVAPYAVKRPFAGRRHEWLPSGGPARLRVGWSATAARGTCHGQQRPAGGLVPA
jgi:hypothetical protein